MGRMMRAKEQRFWAEFIPDLDSDDGAAAKAHLAAGRPVHYCDDRYPDGVVRLWPDGRRDLVSVDFDDGGTVPVVRALPA